MMVNFWVSAFVGFCWKLWPRKTILILTGLTGLSGIVWVIKGLGGVPQPTTVSGTLFALFGGWQTWGEVLLGWLFGLLMAVNYRIGIEKDTKND